MTGLRAGQPPVIDYVYAPCSLGNLLLAATDRGLRALWLGDDPAVLAADFCQQHPQASLAANRADLAAWTVQVQAYLDGRQQALDLPLDIAGTAFQHRVWAALQAIPYGSTITYQQLAEAIGQPTATRAVGHACAANPVALVIPCHRALAANGSLNGYRWGLPRKAALLDLERFGV
ncbi:MAG: methylated-DNA--[protein]-cysteine S-methyltransferase [Caldilineales bacterium]